MELLHKAYSNPDLALAVVFILQDFPIVEVVNETRTVASKSGKIGHCHWKLDGVLSVPDTHWESPKIVVPNSNKKMKCILDIIRFLRLST